MGAACHSRHLAQHLQQVVERLGMLKDLCRQSSIAQPAPWQVHSPRHAAGWPEHSMWDNLRRWSRHINATASLSTTSRVRLHEPVPAHGAADGVLQHHPGCEAHC